MKINILIIAISASTLLCCKKNKGDNTPESNYIIAGSGWKLLATVDHQSEMTRSTAYVEVATSYNRGIHAIAKNSYSTGINEYIEIFTKPDGNLKETSEIPQDFAYSYRKFFLTPNVKEYTSLNMYILSSKNLLSVSRPDGSRTNEYTSGSSPVLCIESPQKFHSISQQYFQGWSLGYITYLYGHTYESGKLEDLKVKEIGHVMTKDTLGIGLSSNPCYYFDNQRAFWMLDTRRMNGKNHLFVWKQDSIETTGSQPYKILRIKKKIPDMETSSYNVKHTSGIMFYMPNSFVFNNFDFASQTVTKNNLVDMAFPGQDKSLAFEANTRVRTAVGENGVLYVALFYSGNAKNVAHFSVLRYNGGSSWSVVGKTDFLNMFHNDARLGFDNLFVINNKPVISIFRMPGNASKPESFRTTDKLMFVGAE